jgi:galactose mutarotase-like enzyme
MSSSCRHIASHCRRSGICRKGVCVEPVSQRPNAFNAAAGDQPAAGVAMLEPRQSTTVVQRFDYLSVSDANEAF